MSPSLHAHLKGGIGIVIERQRRVGERDGIKWFTSGGETLHEEYFTCTDLGTDLKPIIERFHDSQEFKTGERSAASPPLPEPEVEIDAEVSLGNAFSLEKWIDASFAMESSSRADWTGNSRKLFAETSNQGDFDVDVIFGCTPARDQEARGRSQVRWHANTNNRRGLDFPSICAPPTCTHERKHRN